MSKVCSKSNLPFDNSSSMLIEYFVLHREQIIKPRPVLGAKHNKCETFDNNSFIANDFNRLCWQEKKMQPHV